MVGMVQALFHRGMAINASIVQPTISASMGRTLRREKSFIRSPWVCGTIGGTAGEGNYCVRNETAPANAFRNELSEPGSGRTEFVARERAARFNYLTSSASRRSD